MPYSDAVVGEIGHAVNDAVLPYLEAPGIGQVLLREDVMAALFAAAVYEEVMSLLDYVPKADGEALFEKSPALPPLDKRRGRARFSYGRKALIVLSQTSGSV